MKKILIISVLVVLTIAVGWYFFGTSPVSEENTEDTANHVTFRCDNNKEINAAFSDGEVEFSLSDGRSFALLQVRASSGAKFSNRDGSIVLETNDYRAFLEENEESTYTGCRIYPLPFPVIE